MSIDPNLTVLIIALVNAVTAWMVWRTHVATKVVQGDVLRIEKATNSMKDALVAKTAEASEAKGRDDERKIGEAKAAAVAEGTLVGKETK